MERELQELETDATRIDEIEKEKERIESLSKEKGEVKSRMEQVQKDIAYVCCGKCHIDPRKTR